MFAVYFPPPTANALDLILDGLKREGNDGHAHVGKVAGGDVENSLVKLGAVLVDFLHSHGACGWGDERDESTARAAGQKGAARSTCVPG